MTHHRDPGSFRDPSGFVLHDQEKVYRLFLDQTDADLMGELEAQGFIQELVSAGLLVGSKHLPAEETKTLRFQSEFEAKRVIQHQRIPFISYPYEWPLSMLADAGLSQLKLQRKLLEKGYSLKDATAFNTQFQGTKPLFIDLASIERPKRYDVWQAYAQFSSMFLYPLMLIRNGRATTRSYFLANLNGLDAIQVARSYPWISWCFPRVFLDIKLPALLARMAQKKKLGRLKRLEEKPPASGNPNDQAKAKKRQIFLLDRLENRLQSLKRGYRPRSDWSDYAQTNSYSKEAEGMKRTFVYNTLKALQPKRLTDLGSNTGTYSKIAADCGAQVLALDSDHDSVELLYREVVNSNLAILPLWIDITNPSPGCGHLNQERPAFIKRHNADCLLALALIHHLLVAARIPLQEIVELFALLTSQDLIVEYVAPEDAMFQSLLGLRENIYGFFTEQAFEAAFSKRFSIEKKEAVPHSKRVLYAMKRLS